MSKAASISPTAPGPAVLRGGLPDRWQHLRKFAGKPCEILSVEPTGYGNVSVVRARFEPETESAPPVEVRDVPAAFFAVAANAPKRRSRLALREPKDTRSEAQRMDDGLAWIKNQYGYEYLRVGQGKVAAVCHCCSKKSREQGGPSLVKIHCKVCGSLGFSPSTNSTKGTPDSFIFHARWPDLAILPVEWKDGEHGERSPEQADLERRGRIAVAWDTPSLLRIIARYERDLPHIPVHPEIAAYLEKHAPQTAQAEEGAA